VKAWKVAEKKVAAIVGGTRIGVTGLPTNDVKHERLAIEVKHTSKPPVFVVNALAQAKANGEAGKVPLAVIHTKGTRQYLAVLRLEDLVTLIRDSDLLEKVVNNDAADNGD